MTQYRSRIEERKVGDRRYQMIPIKGEDGRMVKGHRIICAKCQRMQDIKRSNLRPDEGFRKIGWFVGHNEQHDFCPVCIESETKGKKVINMADHKPTAAAQPTPAPAIPREDGRLISRSIEEHWNEPQACYQIDWSDVKLAEHLGVDVSWVKTIRERDFGGTGEDPNIQVFIASQIDIRRDIGALTTQIGMIEDKLKNTAAVQHEAETTLNHYRNGHRRLLERVEQLNKIAETIAPRK